MRTITVSWTDWLWLHKYTGMPRFDLVWAYRRWNKGHGRGRRW